MLRLALAASSLRTSVRSTVTTSRFVRMSSSKPAHLNKMFVLEKSAETISRYSEFRRVLWTGEHSQLVCMTVPVGGEIGEEIHTVDQVLTFTSGTAKAIVNGEEREVGAGDIVIVPAGCKHNFITTSGTPLVLFTVYAPAEHNEKTIHKTKEEGDELEEAGKDEPPEWSQKYQKKE